MAGWAGGGRRAERAETEHEEEGEEREAGRPGGGKKKDNSIFGLIYTQLFFLLLKILHDFLTFIFNSEGIGEKLVFLEGGFLFTNWAVCLFRLLGHSVFVHPKEERREEEVAAKNPSEERRSEVSLDLSQRPPRSTQEKQRSKERPQA